MDPLIGGALGAIARLIPEGLKFLDRKGERKHELALGEQSLKTVQVAGTQKLESEKGSQEAAQIIAGIEALKSAYAAPTSGVKWVDAVSTLVRPWITAVIFHMWVAVKVAAFWQLSNAGIDWTVAVQTMWTSDDAAMLFGVTNFWFLSRVFEKKA